MKLNRKLLLAPLALTGMLFAGMAQAIPELQVYLEGATAGDQPGDADTWFGTQNPFDLQLIGNYGNANSNVVSITNGVLVFTVPDGQSLTLNFAICDAGGTCASMASGTALLDAYADHVAFESYIDGLRTDDILRTNNHTPYGAADSEVDLFALTLEDLREAYGIFSRVLTGLPDCNADTAGTTTCIDDGNQAQGEIKYLRLEIGGVDYAHMDLLALFNYTTGREWVWNENPGSHDSTCCTRVSEPTSLSLLGLGLLGAGLIRRKIATR